MTKYTIVNDLTSDMNVIGTIIKTNRGGDAKIIKRTDGNYYLIEFMDEYKHQVSVKMYSIRLGKIANPYAPTVKGMGYIGVGEYLTHLDNKQTVPYARWNYIIYQSYGKNPTTTMCDEWLNYQIFAKWFTDIFITVPESVNTRVVGTLDINQVAHYSPDTAHLVPVKVNSFLTVINYKKNVGVYTLVGKRATTYNVKVSTDKGVCNIGTYSTLEEAQRVYSERVEKVIHNLADKHKDWLSENTYNQLSNWAYPIQQGERHDGYITR